MKEQRGFSLIEVLIATTVFAVGMLALAGMLSQSIKNNKGSDNFAIATSLAQSQIEALKSVNPATLSDGADGDLLDPFGRRQADLTTQFEKDKCIFTRSWTVANTGTGGRLVTVTVRWNEGVDQNGNQIARSVSTATIM